MQIPRAGAPEVGDSASDACGRQGCARHLWAGRRAPGILNESQDSAPIHRYYDPPLWDLIAGSSIDGITSARNCGPERGALDSRRNRQFTRNRVIRGPNIRGSWSCAGHLLSTPYPPCDLPFWRNFVRSGPLGREIWPVGTKKSALPTRLIRN